MPSIQFKVKDVHDLTTVAHLYSSDKLVKRGFDSEGIYYSVSGPDASQLDKIYVTLNNFYMQEE